jgi:hypothetical protein
MNVHAFSSILLTLLIFSLPIDTLAAKPRSKKTTNSPNVVTIGDGIKFTFQRCTQIPDQEKVVCQGSFRSSNGERTLMLYRTDSSGPTKITDSRGKTYFANEIQVGGDYNCRETGEMFTSCGSIEITLVEGVDYSTTFTFTNAPLPLSKISLFSIGYFYINQSYYIKYRNVLVN